ncbi:uncharacterized protein LOC110686746 [Chenopodium quinoa]|uniref:uncharacterized protein LOC110686746 n=1 Tax=Chenopodium quinoa TaxID=63459 RepID=UPI000B78C015|nr:uncharacterized protein LOC110686746 [Chenopodium quinoa]
MDFLGYLNEVTSPSDKSGGLKFRQSQCTNLNKLAEAACMVDLGFSGNPFTWHNAREGLSLIQERLDRAMGNPSWLNTYPNTQVSYLARTYSDHSPILISLFDNRKGGPYLFRCKAAWLEHCDFTSFFVNNWDLHNFDFLKGKNEFLANVKNWNHNIFGNIAYHNIFGNIAYQ